MNWKDLIRPGVKKEIGVERTEVLINFISTEIIEKLIADIELSDHEQFEDGCNTETFGEVIKQQLRDKWL